MSTRDDPLLAFGIIDEMEMLGVPVGVEVGGDPDLTTILTALIANEL